MSRTYALLENDDEWREAVDNIQIELQKIHAGLKKVEDLNRANLKCQWGPSKYCRRSDDHLQGLTGVFSTKYIYVF